MLRFVKKMLSAVLVTVMLVSALPVHAAVAESVLAESYSLSAEELIVRIEDTYDQAGHIAGRRRFKGKCSSLVNCSILALGIQTQRYHGDGRDEYNLYEEISRTDLGYDVVCYDASEYTLEAALNAITENGTRDAYNLIVGFEGGRTATSSKYGHACFVHGIVDGVVYYSESYDLELAVEDIVFAAEYDQPDADPAVTQQAADLLAYLISLAEQEDTDPDAVTDNGTGG